MSHAAAAQGLDRFQPMDIMSHSSHDILLDPVFEALLKLCWSGCIGLHSRLKMKPGGPPALRTPEYMDGVPNLTPTQLQKVRDSKEIHRRGRAILYAVMSRGGIGVLEQPPGSLAWLEPENHSLFKTFQGHLAWADACKYGKNWAKAWCFASNSPRIGRLAALCNHNIQHESIAGVKNSKGEYLSTLTAEYPPLLAQQIIQSVSHRVSRISGECRPLPLQGTSSFRAPLGPRLKMCDGAGNFSSADHSLPRTVEPHHSIAKAWLQWAAKSGLDKRIFAHVAQGKNEPPLTSAEMLEAIGLLFETIRQPLPSNLEPERQQPYRLQILRILRAVTDDPDMALLHFMEHGVLTGATSPIPTSHQWPPATEQSEMEASTPLDLCDGNGKAATEHPTEVSALIQKEIDNGWVIEANMSVAEGQKNWPSGTAVGKLNIVFAEGKEPRLVLDSTICGVNPRCHLG